MADWIQNKKMELTNIKQLERALMNRPDMRAALNRYVASLDLQGQINRGAITDQQAAYLFRKAILDFSYTMNKAINQLIQHKSPDQPDLNDLTNPLNMVQALNNPDSLASIQFNDTATSIIFTTNEEADANEQAQNQQQMINQQDIQENTLTQDAPMQAPTPEPTSHAKEALLVTAVLGVTLGKDEIEHAFEKYIGKDLKDELGKFKEPKELEDELNKIKSPFEIPTFKPKPPKDKE